MHQFLFQEETLHGRSHQCGRHRRESEDGVGRSHTAASALTVLTGSVLSPLANLVDFDSQTTGIEDEVTFQWSDDCRSHIGGCGVPRTQGSIDGWSTRHPWKSLSYGARRYWSSRCSSRDAWCQRYPRDGGRGQGGLRSCLLTLWCLIRNAGEDWAGLCRARKSQNARFSAYPNN
jgi:hypothetical protein